jgi:hypothetical protein
VVDKPDVNAAALTDQINAKLTSDEASLHVLQYLIRVTGFQNVALNTGQWASGTGPLVEQFSEVSKCLNVFYNVCYLPVTIKKNALLTNMVVNSLFLCIIYM